MREFALESQSTAAIAKTASRDYLAWRIPQILDLQDAIAAAAPIAEKRIVQAGLRIAALLESAFAPGPIAPPDQTPSR